MNQTFDLHRFGLILKLEIAEKGRNYLLLAALLVIFLVLLMSPVAMSSTYSVNREVLHYLALFMVLLFGSSLYSSNALTQYTSPSSGISAIMIPASNTEKFLSSLLLNFVFILPFVLFFFQFHLLTFEYANQKLASGKAAAEFRYNPMTAEVIVYICYYYFLIHAVVFFGSIFFSKASYLKTAAFGVAFFLLIVALNTGLCYFFTLRDVSPDNINAMPFIGWKLWYAGISNGPVKMNPAYYHIQFPQNTLVFLYGIPALIIVSIWYAAFLRQKEKQI